MNTKTTKLYQQDTYLRTCRATVLSCHPVDEQHKSIHVPAFCLVMDQTVFFPEGGGQPCDLGTIDGYAVTEVYEREGIVCHVLSCLGASDREKDLLVYFAPGREVQAEIQWDRRFRHMQRHCGEHILSGVFFAHCGGVNRGFHMGDDYMTIDIDQKDISWEQALAAETATNEIIWQNLPVTVRRFARREEADNLPLRKPLALDEEITIVCVGDEFNPADSVACCGTHPSTSGQVGLLKIFKLENYKGMTRIYFEAGQDALKDYQKKHEIITQLNKKYSADTKDLLEKLEIQEKKSKDVQQGLYEVKRAYLSLLMDDLTATYEQEKQKSGKNIPLVIKSYDHLSVNDLLTLSRSAAAQFSALLLLISPAEQTVILSSDGAFDCGKTVKENAQIWRGKGGGNLTGARALFPSKDDLDCFVTFIRQSYGGQTKKSAK